MPPRTLRPVPASAQRPGTRSRPEYAAAALAVPAGTGPGRRTGYSRTSSLVPGTSFRLTEVDWTNTV